jgi:hypothetical protein
MTRTAAASGLRVLIIEDNSDAAEMLAVILRMYGHDVEVAPNGTTALEMVRTEMPDVVLLDLGLPGMDGYELPRTFGHEVAPSPRLRLQPSSSLWPSPCPCFSPLVELPVFPWTRLATCGSLCLPASKWGQLVPRHAGHCIFSCTETIRIITGASCDGLAADSDLRGR